MFKRRDVSNGGLHVPLTDDELNRFEPPHTSPACKAFTLGGVRDRCLSKPKKIIKKSYVKWVHASAQQIERVLVDSDGGNGRPVNYADEALEDGEVCRAFDNAFNVPLAATSTVSMFNGKLRVELLFFDDIIALRSMDV